MSQAVRFERIDGVGVVTLDNPPVNALSLELRAALRDALVDGLEDGEVDALVLTGGGRMFSAGADITEFESGRSNEPPTLRDLIDLVENSPKPVVAAMHGNAMGGGCELPLACHARVATEGTRIGLPEVNIGIVPGAGGTQRLPRVIGVQAALDMIVSGKPIPAERAEEVGLVAEVVHEGGDLIATAVALAQELATRDSPPPKTRDRDRHLAEARDNPSVFDDLRKSIARRSRGFEAPFACIDCVEAAVTKPFDEGLAFERDTFQRLRTSGQAKALRHVFFAERQAGKVDGIGPDTAEYPVGKAAVLGCGTMGGGIAMCFANAGIPVTVTEGEQSALDRGMDIIRKNYAGSVSKGRMSQKAMDRCMALITPTLDFDAIAHADIVVEAVFESMDLKKEIFGKLDRLCDANTVLATNTSSLDVNEIASVTSRPEDVLGLHFFSPANVMKLLEIVRAEKTSPEVLKTALNVSKRLGKVGVVVGVCDSFAANRSLYAYTRQAGFLLEEGALPEQVDKVIYDFGFPMGPFAVGDLAGIDVGYKIRQHRGRPEGLRYSEIADKLYEMGRYGQKTGAGWFKYEEGSRAPIPDPVVTELVLQTSANLGIERREIADEEILQRCLYPLINEGAKILEEGIVQRASDFDLVWLYGYGFPRYHGGPMFWADQLGLDHVYEVMKGFYEEHRDWLEPAKLLERLAEEGGTFGEWSAA